MDYDGMWSIWGPQITNTPEWIMFVGETFLVYKSENTTGRIICGYASTRSLDQDCSDTSFIFWRAAHRAGEPNKKHI